MRAPTWLVIQEQGIGEDADGRPAWLVSARIRWWHPRAWQWLWSMLPGPTWRKPLCLGYWLARQSGRRIRGAP